MTNKLMNKINDEQKIFDLLRQLQNSPEEQRQELTLKLRDKVLDYELKYDTNFNWYGAYQNKHWKDNWRNGK